MAELNTGFLPLFRDDTYYDLVAALEELETEFLILGKKIRRQFREMLESLPQKLGKSMKKLGTLLTDAFRVETLEDYTQAAAIYGEELAGALYQLQIDLNGLKIAIIQAAAPIVQVLLPVVQLAIRALTGLAQSIGYVFRMLFLGTAEVEDYSSGVQTAVSANKSLKRSLMGFDQINRLSDQNGGGSAGIIGGAFDTSTVKPLSGTWKKLADKLLELLEPLKKIDLTPAAKSLERLVEALKPITKELFKALEWAWYNIFVPLAEWAVEELLPVFLDTLAVALENLAIIIEELKPYLKWLWEECLKPWAEWKGSQLIDDLKGLQDQLSGVTGWAGTNKSFVDSMVESGINLIGTLGTIAQESMGVSDASEQMAISIENALLFLAALSTPLQSVAVSGGMLSFSIGGLINAFSDLSTQSEDACNSMGDSLSETMQRIRKNFLDPLNEGLRQTCNGTTGMLNGMLDSVVMAINHVSQSMNSLNFTFPDWFPMFGGKTFSFGLKKISTPTIPQLARGAVLPANKPFMAIVGDQKHGTNVEAPLSVIQEAVAAVMADYAAGNMAGHEATVSVLRELLAAVLGISIGDDVIAAAVSRYDRKMAVVRGGF